MYVTVCRDFVDVVGRIWMPAVVASMRYPLTAYDLENIGDFTRENVEDWLTSRAGDFQEVIDFYATAEHVTIPWATEEGELYFNTFSEEE